MTVTEYTVSDAEGNTAESKFIGTIVGVPGNPFVFYVRNPGTPGQPLEVQIVMPLGGTESGLFRFPRVGEQVLVGTETASGTNLHYLMGYIPIKTPSSQNFQTAGMFQDDGRGEVFRYRQTGKRKAPPGEKYSEIGFYHKQTAWRAAKGEQSNYADNQDATGAYVYPKIDRINIHSTGDIHESAVNHHRVQAKRFELLVDAEGKDGRPLGDNPGDDSGLHAGDVHIRAGNRVVLKAGDEIILQVGKTVLKINDDGLDIASKVINSNVSNPYDATVSINRGGISLFGFAVTINSIKSFDIGDAFSGGLASNLGIVSLGGREIKADAYDSAEFKAVVIGALQQHALSIKAGAEGLTGLSALDMLPFTEPDKKPDTAESDTSADDANSKAPDDTGIVTPELNAPKEEEISSSANALDIGIFVLTYGNDVFNMVKRVYKFIQKIVGLSKQFAEITQKLVFERKKEAEEAKKKAVDDAKKAKEEAVKGAEEAKKKALDDAKKAKEEAVRQAKQDMAMGNITKEEMEKRIADANEKEKKETEYRTRVAKLATADAELREARIVAEATAKEADAIAKAESLQAKKDAELSRKQAEEKNEAARKAALEKEKQDKAQADQTKAERIRKAEDDFLKDTENGMSKEDALAKMNNEKKQAAADANKEKQKATEERWETTKKEYAHTEEEKKEADNKEKQKKAEIEETRKKTQKDVEEKKREEETKWQNAHKF